MTEEKKIYVTLTGLPLSFTLRWPFHKSTSGADFWVLHTDVRLENSDGLHALAAVNMSATVREIMPSLDPKDVGVSYAKLSDLQVNNVDESADVLREIFAGKSGPRRDIAALNAAAALIVAGMAADLNAGLKLAMQALDSGTVRQTLASLVRCSIALLSCSCAKPFPQGRSACFALPAPPPPRRGRCRGP